MAHVDALVAERVAGRVEEPQGLLEQLRSGTVPDRGGIAERRPAPDCAAPGRQGDRGRDSGIVERRPAPGGGTDDVTSGRRDETPAAIPPPVVCTPRPVRSVQPDDYTTRAARRDAISAAP